MVVEARIPSSFSLWECQTPNILLTKTNDTIDVLTCAAPNYRAASLFVTKNENNVILWNRCKFVLDIMEEQNAEIIVLGPFGCGVFGQDPVFVSNCWHNLLASSRYNFKQVIFSAYASNDTDINYTAFKNEFS